MHELLTIAVAHQDVNTRSALQAILAQVGYGVCIEAVTGRQLIEMVPVVNPALIIVQEELPDMSGVAAASQAMRNQPIPVVVLVDRRVNQSADIAAWPNVVAVLTEPVKPADFVSTIPLATERFRQLRQLRAEIKQLAATLPDEDQPTSPRLVDGD